MELSLIWRLNLLEFTLQLLAPTSFLSNKATISNLDPELFPSMEPSMMKEPLSKSGVILSSDINVLGRASNQTVCHIPVVLV
jgi:hypothetical protein